MDFRATWNISTSEIYTYCHTCTPYVYIFEKKTLNINHLTFLFQNCRDRLWFFQIFRDKHFFFNFQRRENNMKYQVFEDRFSPILYWYCIRLFCSEVYLPSAKSLSQFSCCAGEYMTVTGTCLYFSEVSFLDHFSRWVKVPVSLY